jgi:hypothetical protein
VYLEVGTMGRVFAYADEDLARADETKTSAVPFLRFELGAQTSVLCRTRAGAWRTKMNENETLRERIQKSQV